jgi:TPP-dependent pyruvate/acetoin dehydrogenase alpha subunit
MVESIAARVKQKIDEVETFAVQSPEPEPESVIETIFDRSEVS